MDPSVLRGSSEDQPADHRQARQDHQRHRHDRRRFMHVMQDLVVDARLAIERHVDQAKHIKGGHKGSDHPDEPEDVVP
jgi:hypothetical protein